MDVTLSLSLFQLLSIENVAEPSRALSTLCKYFFPLGQLPTRFDRHAQMHHTHAYFLTTMPLMFFFFFQLSVDIQVYFLSSCLVTFYREKKTNMKFFHVLEFIPSESDGFNFFEIFQSRSNTNLQKCIPQKMAPILLLKLTYSELLPYYVCNNGNQLPLTQINVFSLSIFPNCMTVLIYISKLVLILSLIDYQIKHWLKYCFPYDHQIEYFSIG